MGEVNTGKRIVRIISTVLLNMYCTYEYVLYDLIRTVRFNKYCTYCEVLYLFRCIIHGRTLPTPDPKLLLVQMGGFTTTSAMTCIFVRIPLFLFLLFLPLLLSPRLILNLLLLLLLLLLLTGIIIMG